jgi:hypothetical protein
LYVCQAAWLNATPRQQDKSNTGAISRLKVLQKSGNLKPEMPECKARYLVDYLFEIGPTQGDAPLSHTELQAWQQNIGITLQPWEARFIKSLSIEYLGQYREAAAPDCPVPWADAPYAKLAVNMVSKNLKAAITGMESL